jgi:hypothetical protein
MMGIFAEYTPVARGTNLATDIACVKKDFELFTADALTKRCMLIIVMQHLNNIL